VQEVADNSVKALFDRTRTAAAPVSWPRALARLLVVFVTALFLVDAEDRAERDQLARADTAQINAAPKAISELASIIPDAGDRCEAPRPARGKAIDPGCDDLLDIEALFASLAAASAALPSSSLALIRPLPAAQADVRNVRARGPPLSFA
jgi:hypothetical protein